MKKDCVALQKQIGNKKANKNKKKLIIAWCFEYHISYFLIFYIETIIIKY